MNENRYKKKFQHIDFLGGEEGVQNFRVHSEL